MEAKRRGTYIGGPDAAAIVGVHPWHKPTDVALRLTGVTGEIEDNWPMRAGRVLEREILDDYEGRHNVTVVERNTFRAHPQWAWSGSHIDGLVKRGPLVVEAKTTQSEFGYGAEGTDEIPEYNLVQVQYYMNIWECDTAHLVVLIKNRELREYVIPYDAELANMVFQACDEFYQRVVVHGEMPQLDGSEACHAYLARRYPRDTRPMLIADPSQEALLAALRDARGALALNTAHCSEVEAQVKAMLGDAAGIESAIGKVTWKAGKPSNKLDMKQLVEELKPLVDPVTFAAAVARHTTEKPGSRTFLVPRAWSKINHEGENDDE